MQPFPRRPCDRADDRLKHPGREVDQQVSHAAVRHFFQVLADRLDMPVVDKLLARLDDVPRLLQELVEAVLRSQPPIHLGDGGGEIKIRHRP